MYSVAIVGATGAVGTEMLKVLDDLHFPVSSIRLFASPASAGKTVTHHGKEYTIETATPDSFRDIDIALFSAGSGITKEYKDWVIGQGCVLIDNSSAYRMDPSVPLVIPEINKEALRDHSGMIAVPNCSTIVMLMAVAPLRRLGKIKRIVVSTYQAVSGAGAKAMKELEEQTAQVLRKEEITKNVFPHQVAFNLFSHNTEVNSYGYNAEEWKMINETKKILNDDSIAITATCVRVPVMRAHSESVNIEFEGKRPSVAEIREALSNFPGVKLQDDPEANHFPMPVEASGQYDVLVGRIREDVSNPNAIDLFVSGDQLLKGAALDAVQIAVAMHEMGLLQAKAPKATAPAIP